MLPLAIWALARALNHFLAQHVNLKDALPPKLGQLSFLTEWLEVTTLDTRPAKKQFLYGALSVMAMAHATLTRAAVHVPHSTVESRVRERTVL
jgi:hypothetical protein